MEIELRLFANLADYLPAGGRGGAARLDVPDGTTVAAVLRQLGLPDALPRLLLVNDRDAAPEQRLRAGDVVTVLPPLAGGAA
jgi:sulfur carrier protein ThiS